MIFSLLIIDFFFFIFFFFLYVAFWWLISLMLAIVSVLRWLFHWYFSRQLIFADYFLRRASMGRFHFFDTFLLSFDYFTPSIDDYFWLIIFIFLSSLLSRLLHFFTMWCGGHFRYASSSRSLHSFPSRFSMCHFLLRMWNWCAGVIIFDVIISIVWDFSFHFISSFICGESFLRHFDVAFFHFHFSTFHFLHDYFEPSLILLMSFH